MDPATPGLDARLRQAAQEHGIEAVIPDLPGGEPLEPALREALLERAAQRLASAPPRTRHLHPDGRPRYTNRLARSVSPYLLQHAHNPVDWHPWGEAAFDKARALDRPVFLSVGYSTCHWCHVMEEESFEDEEIAAYLNAHYVPVKVDREQRPDVDDVYMTTVQLMTRHGGWPMTVVMTPSGEPFFGATYIPPRAGARGARQGLLELLGALSRAYDERRDEVVAQARQVSEAMAEVSAPAPPADMPGDEVIGRAARQYVERFDARHGGVGGAPKFPQASIYGLLLRHHVRAGDARALEVVTRTLDAMADGGIHDQVGGGFHRYATDARWLVPHFEKMLYDNAQLAVLYLDAYQVTGREAYAAVARKTLDYVAREMTDPGGGFYSATDADSEGEEGLFFVWRPQEVRGVLGEAAAELVIRHHGVTPEGNFEGRSILHVARPLEAVADELGLAPDAARRQLSEAHARLYEARAARVPPGLDDKVLAAWNGLMIGAFARGARVLDAPEYAARAAAAARFVRDHMWRDGVLLRSYRAGRAEQPGYLDDHAFMIHGLLELLEYEADAAWLAWALELQGVLDARFIDAERGGYFYTSDAHEALLYRQKPAYDGAEPGGNSVAAENLLRLALLTGDHAWRARAEGLLAAFADAMRRQPTAQPRLLSALGAARAPAREVVVVTPGERGDAAPLLAVLRERFSPNDVQLVVAQDAVADLAVVAPTVAGKVAQGDAATAYVCDAAGRCARPTTDPEALRRQLAAPEDAAP